MVLSKKFVKETGLSRVTRSVIEQEELESIGREYERSLREHQLDYRALLARIDRLERKVDRLESRIYEVNK